MKVVFCTPSISGPTAPYIAALEKSIPLIKEAGWEEQYVQEIGCPYISHARATMTRKALDAGADVIVYLDYDLSWDPKDLLKLIQTEGDVVAGTYRYKKDEEEYMGAWVCDADTRPSLIPGTTMDDPKIRGFRVPAGFLKVTKNAIRTLMRKFPELLYGDVDKPHIDLFNHGAHDFTWYGEDMAFSRRWKSLGGEIILIPNMNIDHHKKLEDGSYKAFKGNLYEYLLNLPQPNGAQNEAV